MEYGCAYSFVGAPTNHSGNDSSSSTSCSRHVHFFHHTLLVFVPGTFLRVLTTSIILVQLSQESWKKRKKNTEQDQPAVRQQQQQQQQRHPQQKQAALPPPAAAGAAAAAVEKQVFRPTLIRPGAKDRPPCFVLRQSPSMPRRNCSIRREEPSIAIITADLRPFVTHTGLTVKTALFLLHTSIHY